MKRRKAKPRSDTALTEVHQTAVRMRAQGYTAKAVGIALEVHPNTVYRWDSQARAGGDEALRVARRSRKVGEKRRLYLLQELEVHRRIRPEPGIPGIVVRAVDAPSRAGADGVGNGGAMPIRTVGLY